MYTLPVLIQSRRNWTCELTSIELVKKEPKTFVIDIANAAAFNIMQINANAYLKAFKTNETDVQLSQVACTATYENNTAQINLTAKQVQTPQAKPLAPTETPTAKKSFWDDDDDQETTQKEEPMLAATPTQANINTEYIKLSEQLMLQILVQNGNITLRLLLSQLNETNVDVSEIPVHINFIVNQTIYQRAINFVLAHPNRFLNIAIDYGSEASQMVLLKHDLGNGNVSSKIETQSLFQMVKRWYLHKTSEIDTGLPFYQEERNTNFFKSIFFAKQKLEGNLQDTAHKFALPQPFNNLKMLVDKNSANQLQAEGYIQTPNFKIIEKQDNILASVQFEYQPDKKLPPISESLNDLYPRINFTILKNMLESVLMADAARHRNTARNLRINLLVPNIYELPAVLQMQQIIQQIITDLKQSPDLAQNLLACEVVTVSESDAAFMGYMSLEGTIIQKDAQYLIIDTGKGTTDFSIIKTGTTDAFDIKTMYRNGFAGASNLISHAIFETILHLIREHAPADRGHISFIEEHILNRLSKDIILKNELFEQIERLKFNYTNDVNCLQQWKSAKDVNIGFNNLTTINNNVLETVISLIKQIDTISDFYGYINTYCALICEKVVGNLESVQKNMKDKNLSGVMFTGRGFMFELLRNMMSEQITQRLNVPTAQIKMLSGNQLKEVCIKGVFNPKVIIDAEQIGVPILSSKVQEQSNVTPENVSKQKLDFWDRIEKKLPGWITQTTQEKQQVKRILLNKKVNAQQLQQSEILIGASKYSATDRMNNDEDMHSSIDFTESGYQIRHFYANTSTVAQTVTLQRNLVLTTDNLQMVIPSLFPNYIDERYLLSLRAALTPPAQSNGLMF